MVGSSRPTEGPGLSAFIRYIRKRDNRNTRTPIPPIQWVKLLQKIMHLGTTSTSVRTLAPVVVNPDMVSNRASTGLVKVPENRKGSPPITLMAIQQRATATNPSRILK